VAEHRGLDDTTLLQYDREELYQQVWEKPMLKVAEEYGVSSVALGNTSNNPSRNAAMHSAPTRM